MEMSDLAGAADAMLEAEGTWAFNPAGFVNVSSISAANPAVVTTTTAHGRTTGNKVILRNIVGGTPALSDQLYAVTVIDATSFSIPVNVTIAPTASSGYVEPFESAVVGIKNHHYHDNTYVDSYNTTRVGIFVGAYDAAIPAQDIEINNENFNGMATVWKLAGPFNNVGFHHNTARGVNGNAVLVQIGPSGVKPTYDHGTSEAQAFYGYWTFESNFIYSNGDSGANPLYLNLDASSITSQFGKFDVIGDNWIVSTRASSAIAMACRFSSASITAKLTVRGTHIDGFAVGYDASNVALYTLEDNETVNTAVGFQNGGTISVFERSGNNFSVTSISSGFSNLTAGTVTIATGEAIANDRVEITRVSVGGTPGFLSYSVVAATSLTITSSSATDTSQVFWRFVH